MQPEFWNSRYNDDVYAYGKEANDFLINQSFEANSRILCLAEGEGRNAVYLATQGHAVSMIDYAEEGLRKAQQLAAEKGVQIETLCQDLTQTQLQANAWDAIVVIFGHLPVSVRTALHSQFYQALKPGGKLIMELYSKDQLQYKTGGPQDVNLLYSVDELTHDLSEFESLHVMQMERFISEGTYHNGLSSVVQVVAQKKIIHP